MARFKLYLAGNGEPLDVELPVANVLELCALLSAARFIDGHFSEPDGDGVCRALLVPSSRVHLIVEGD